MIGFPGAWTPGTNGPVVAEVVQVDIGDEADFEKFRGKLKGRIVLTQPKRAVRMLEGPFILRMTDADFAEAATVPAPAGRGRPAAGPHGLSRWPGGRKRGPTDPGGVGRAIPGRGCEVLGPRGPNCPQERSKRANPEAVPPRGDPTARPGWESEDANRNGFRLAAPARALPRSIRSRPRAGEASSRSPIP